MDLVNFTQDMAIKSGVDMMNYVVSYIDQNIIAYDLARFLQVEEYFVRDNEVNPDKRSLGVTLSVIRREEYKNAVSCLCDYVQKFPQIAVSGKYYNVECEVANREFTHDRDEVKILINPYDYPGINFEPAQIIEE